MAIKKKAKKVKKAKATKAKARRPAARRRGLVALDAHVAAAPLDATFTAGPEDAAPTCAAPGPDLPVPGGGLQVAAGTPVVFCVRFCGTHGQARVAVDHTLIATFGSEGGCVLVTPYLTPGPHNLGWVATSVGGGFVLVWLKVNGRIVMRRRQAFVAPGNRVFGGVAIQVP